MSKPEACLLGRDTSCDRECGHRLWIELRISGAVIVHVAALGLSSGAIYDALHANCARRERVDQILTYNLVDFARFEIDGIPVAAP